MAEEKETSVSQQEKVDDSIDYIEAIKEIKQNSVAKSEYEKVKQEKKKLLDAFVKGEEYKVQEEKVDIDKLRKELYGKDCDRLNNLEYIEKTLKLRNALIEQGARDPFLPIGEKVDITQDQVDLAEKAATIFQECVDFAQGDSGIFTAELQRRTTEAMPAYKHKR